jgi:hypothetical protein
MITRAEIADAVNAAAIPGVTAQPGPPDVHQPGIAYPVWRQAVPLASGFESSWDLYVVLPAGYPVATIDAADPLVGLVGGALRGVGVFTGVDTVSLATAPDGSAVMPALRFNLTTI